MFDTIGHTPDPGRTRRAASAAVLLTSLSGGLIGTALMVTAWLASGAPDVPPPTEWEMPEMHEQPLVQIELPETPPPPAAAIARGEASDEPVPTTPDEMTDPVDDLDTPPDDAVAEAAPPTGDPDGIDGGDAEGDPDGVIGGDPSGVGDQHGGPYSEPTVHHSQVRLRVRQVPEYPDAAADMNLGRVDCRVSVLISERGMPLDSSFDNCPVVFHESVTAAVSNMRWYPYRIGGQKSKARFTIRFVFEPQ